MGIQNGEYSLYVQLDRASQHSTKQLSVKPVISNVKHVYVYMGVRSRNLVRDVRATK